MTPTPLNATSTPHTKPSLVLYLLPFLLAPLLLILAAIVIVPSRWYALRAGSTYLANVGYATRLHNTQCDLLIAGDSTAMVGIDPAILHARTGLSVCNIAEFRGMSVVNENLMVDQFLRNNPPPRLLLFMYAPEALNHTTWNKVPLFEGITLRMRLLNTATFALFLRHPIEFLAWTEQGLRTTLFHLHTHPFGPEVEHQREAVNGFFPVSGPAQTACEPTRRAGLPDPAFVRNLRQTYTRPGTRVLVDATPTLPCDLALADYRRTLAGLVDDLPYPTLPVSDFLEGSRLHVTPAGSVVLSNLIADQILHLPPAP